jgi:hypothetical protein
VVAKPIIIDRWLNAGRFDHAAHKHVTCNDCHHASGSTATADILMPPKASCAECHRTPDASASPAQIAQLKLGADRAEKQRHLGGAPASCSLCHSYHSTIARSSLPAVLIQAVSDAQGMKRVQGKFFDLVPHQPKGGK